MASSNNKTSRQHANDSHGRRQQSYDDEDDRAHGNDNRGKARMQMTKANRGKARMHMTINDQQGQGPYTQMGKSKQQRQGPYEHANDKHVNRGMARNYEHANDNKGKARMQMTGAKPVCTML